MTGATHAVIAEVIAATVWPGAPIETYLCAVVVLGGVEGREGGVTGN